MVNNTSTNPNLESPFDIDAAPITLASDDAPDQQVTLKAALRAQVGDEDEGEKFFSQRRNTKPLGYYQRMYENGDTTSAMESVMKRNRVDYTSSNHCVRSDGNNLSWTIDRHFIDLKVCVGSGLGLGPMLPNQNTLHTYEFELDLGRPEREFSAKFAKLGFDPVESMLWIGRSPSAEDVWLAWAPKRDDESEESDVATGTGCSGSTALIEKHYRMAVMFLAQMLATLPYRDALVNDVYPDVSEKIEFELASNIL